MTIAITPFEGLCGFRPLAEITYFLKTVAPLRALVGEDAASSFEKAVSDKETASDESVVAANKKALQALFTALMTSSTADIEKQTSALIDLAKSSPSTFATSEDASISAPFPHGEELSKIVIRLNSQFPNDIGSFVFFFLNFVTMSTGEAMFLQADDIHAYVSGDIIECMASSDNVVRAGFTPKFRDVDTLTSMLTYSYAPIDEQKMNPTDYPYVTLNTTAYTSSSSALLYDPPIEEFAVVKTDLNKAGAKATFEALNGPSIIICTQGKGKISVGPKTETVEAGYVFFVGATAECVLESEGDDFVTFKAFCEIDGSQDANGHSNL